MHNTFRYDTSGTWYKGGLHLHTTRSDGQLSPRETTALYHDLGFDFVALTDHWVVSRDAARPAEWPLLVVDGIELDGRDDDGTFYHVVAVGRIPEVRRGMGLGRAMSEARDAGALLAWAHPHWSGNRIEDGLKHRFDAVEVYNHGCHLENSTGSGLVHWTGVLPEAPHMLAWATDDSHQREGVPDAGGGWTMVNCAELSVDAVTAALRAGNSYASNGPAFESIEFVDGVLRVVTSPVSVIRLLGPGWSHVARRAPGDTLTSAEFRVPHEWAYARLDIEDQRRGCAWTNTLFTAG